MAKFKVGDKVRAITENYYYTSKSRKWEGVVTRINGNKFSAKTTECIGCDYLPVIISLPVKDFELIESKPTKNQRITALEKEIAELRPLKEKVEYLEQVVQQYFTVPDKTSTVEDKPKTPNQQRKEIIEKAKGFVEFAGYKDTDGDYWIKKDNRNYCCQVEFIASEEKQTIVALLRNINVNNKVITRGIAKCHPSDVFNEHIGKAIALGRALRLNVCEFEQAVQPNDIIEGMEIMFFNFIGNEHKSGVVTKYDEKNDDVFLTDEKLYSPLASKSGCCHSVKEDGFKILNDTNAIYGGGE